VPWETGELLRAQCMSPTLAVYGCCDSFIIGVFAALQQVLHRAGS